ncbi:endoplasmic reticulum resident protein 44-like [Lingula anatina]|uniref:Endoplasmic reticulum resident protein 44-like n=1 Tax=Lingula anatina TaxID=7574 RepID=A0A1S3HPF8_LINAN|nr:endoplasmic reticulum resident protein 44-like [Lingula anatina]|eukprot:XP_013387938.1 endoplasmic reticulum resident protein 44-like [Lingula anatina]
MHDANLDEVLSSNEVVFVNFYADWCRFSQMLQPIFDDTATKVASEFSPGKVALAKVDCDKESSLAARYHVSKYPTLKLFRNGQPVKREYRGQRSIDAFTNFLKEQTKDVIIEHASSDEFDNTEGKKRRILGMFESKDSENYMTFARVANGLRDDCEFHISVGPGSAKDRVSGDLVLFRGPHTKNEDVVYTGMLNDYEILKQWITDKCIPLVREITFENAEELTEEGLPFLILFHDLDDKETPRIYQEEVAKQIINERNNVNFLTADGKKFAHPLHHLGKSDKDLPVLAIDSFRHMYVFPYDVKTRLTEPGLLKTFIADLHSGKLHREFHHGPDPTPPPPVQEQPSSEDQEEQPANHVPKEPQQPNQPAQHQFQQEQPTDPPESTFRKLAPSRNRYTLLRDEL